MARTVGVSLGLVLLFFFLAFDGRLHWDEAAYLYTGGFLDHEAVLKGEFVGGTYISRLLHIATIAAVVDVVGPGPTALAIRDHLTLSWLSGSPNLLFEQPLREGHYLAYPVRIR